MLVESPSASSAGSLMFREGAFSSGTREGRVAPPETESEGTLEDPETGGLSSLRATASRTERVIMVPAHTTASRAMRIPAALFFFFGGRGGCGCGEAGPCGGCCQP